MTGTSNRCASFMRRATSAVLLTNTTACGGATSSGGLITTVVLAHGKSRRQTLAKNLGELLQHLRWDWPAHGALRGRL